MHEETQKNDIFLKQKVKYVITKRATKKESYAMSKYERLANKKKHKANVTHQCSKHVEVSDKERSRIMSLMKTKAESQEFDDEIAAELGESINNKTNPNNTMKCNKNDTSDTQKIILKCENIR